MRAHLVAGEVERHAEQSCECGDVLIEMLLRSDEQYVAASLTKLIFIAEPAPIMVLHVIDAAHRRFGCGAMVRVGATKREGKLVRRREQGKRRPFARQPGSMVARASGGRGSPAE